MTLGYTYQAAAVETFDSIVSKVSPIWQLIVTAITALPLVVKMRYPDATAAFIVDLGHFGRKVCDAYGRYSGIILLGRILLLAYAHIILAEGVLLTVFRVWVEQLKSVPSTEETELNITILEAQIKVIETKIMMGNI